MREKLLAATLAILFLSACAIGAGLIVAAQSGLCIHAGFDLTCGGTESRTIDIDVATLADDLGETDPFDNSPAAIAHRVQFPFYGTDD